MGGNSRRSRLVAVVCLLVAIISLTLFIFGVVAITRNGNECLGKSSTTKTARIKTGPCNNTAEAINSGLVKLLRQIDAVYFDRFPDSSVLQLSVIDLPLHLIKRYGATPAQPGYLKNITDSATQLYQDLKSLTVNRSLLSVRERSHMAKIEHVLRHAFARPYANYYLGLWMLGPGSLCTQYICLLKQHIAYGVFLKQPADVDGLLHLREFLKEYKELVYQYMRNMRSGVKSGMVRSVEGCKAGIHAFKAKYPHIAQRNATGVFNQRIIRYMLSEGYLYRLNDTVLSEWKAKYGETVEESLHTYVLDYIGKPLHDFISFLEEHSRYCVPSNISSGLANLPLDYIYYDGKRTNQKTSKYLPTGEELDGKKSYKSILNFYTTTNISVEEVYDLGLRKLNELYPQVIDIAKSVTGQQNETVATEMFKKIIKSTDNYYNELAFPVNESNSEALQRCGYENGAKKHCPERWKAFQLWSDETKKIMSFLDPKVLPMFYYTGSRRTTPSCPVVVKPSFNPSIAAQSYSKSSGLCFMPATLFLPFFVDNYGPRYQDMTVNAHEARPGHHTQRQGFNENFQIFCPNSVLSWLDSLSTYWFTEGWALYSELPLIAQHTDVYEKDEMAKYGMLKGQIWRALRLLVDTGFHYNGMKRHKALALFEKYAWDSSDVVEKELTRYQSIQGQATSYMVGQHYFLKFRNYTKAHLGYSFDIRQFHYHVLRHGATPVSHVEREIKDYVECQKHPKLTPFCRQILEGSSFEPGTPIEHRPLNNVEKELYSIRYQVQEEILY